MSEVIIYKKHISSILAIFIVLTGICLHGMQMDSSFVLQKQSGRVLTLSGDSSACQDTVYAVEEPNTQGTMHRGGSRIYTYRVLKNAKTYDDSVMGIEKKHATVQYLQEIDSRLCRTENLSSVFTVLYIHHQDGVKQVGVIC